RRIAHALDSIVVMPQHHDVARRRGRRRDAPVLARDLLAVGLGRQAPVGIGVEAGHRQLVVDDRRALVAGIDGHQANFPRVNVVPSSDTVEVPTVAPSASLRTSCVVAVCVILLRARVASQAILATSVAVAAGTAADSAYVSLLSAATICALISASASAASASASMASVAMEAAVMPPAATLPTAPVTLPTAPVTEPTAPVTLPTDPTTLPPTLPVTEPTAPVTAAAVGVAAVAAVVTLVFMVAVR